MGKRTLKSTAYHEAGHAIVGLNVPDHDPVYKVSIIPRGRALGITMFLPEADRYSTSKRRLESRIATLFGGRVAEEIIFGPEYVTTGASNDIERATEIARSMVTKWGLSDKLGPQTYAEEEGEVFLGRSVTQHKQVSDVTAHVIDEETGFDDADQANRILSLLVRLYNSVVQELEALTYEPIFGEYEDEDGSADLAAVGWCEGFSLGIDLRSAVWETRMSSDPRLMDLLDPIIRISADEGLFESDTTEQLAELDEEDRDQQ